MEESIKTDFITFAKETLQLGKVDIRTYSPLSLAFIGDSVYELVIRTMIVCEGNTRPDKMHKRKSRLVKASAQAALLMAIEEELTEEEETIYKRGRNAKSFSVAKNATVVDYRMATGLEALIGYLYLTEQFERILVLIKLGLERTEHEI